MGLLQYMERKKALTINGEIAVDNFTTQDTDLAFFSLIRSLYLRQNITKVLDYGAGRNYYIQDFNPSTHSFLMKDLRNLQYGGAEVTAVDVSAAVLTHPTSDHQYHIVPDAPLQFENDTFDLIVSDFVFEHLQVPELLASELQRILKPGGWIMARTPNRYGYVALIASLVPNALHTAVLKYVQPDRKDLDVFPTYYRVNTLSKAKKYFNQCDVKSMSEHWEPQYFFGRKWLYLVNKFIHALLPSSLGMTSIFMMCKR